MNRFIARVLKKSSLVAAAAVSMLSFWSAGVITIGQPQLVAAACTPSMSTDQDTNIIFNGIAGATADAQRQSLKTAFDSGDGGNCHTDLKTVFTTSLGQTVALTDTMLSSTTGWTDGITKHDGTIVTDAGKVVGTDAQIYSRCWTTNTTTGTSNCNPLSSYSLVINEKSGNFLGVYQHAATFFTNRANTPEKTLIHLNASGVADFAVWTECGNALRFKPVMPPASLVCTSLTGEFVNGTFERKFTVIVDSQNVAITSLTFSFGDNSAAKVDTVNFPNGHLVFNETHTFTQTNNDQSITSKVTVNGSVTSDSCVDTFPIPAKQVEKNLACTDLVATPKDAAKTQYTFTATATTTNTTADNFTFTFDNGTTETVNATTVSSTKATATTGMHTFAAGSHKITATVSGPLSKNVAGCATSFTVPTPPMELVNTGPGEVVGLFGLTSLLGGVFHQFVLRRKLTA